MYKYIKPVSKEYIQMCEEFLKKAQWKEVKSDDRFFYTYMIELEGAERAFFLKIPPGGSVHKHTDTDRPYRTFHIPVKTNDKCINHPYGNLKVGEVYEIDRSKEHYSINNGNTDRIHLILEMYGEPS